MKSTLRLLHLFNSISSAIAVIIGYLITAWHHEMGIEITVMAAAALATALLSIGGFVVNDIFDVGIDRVNRPDRPLAAGEVTMPVAWALYAGTTVLGLLLAFWVNVTSGVVAVGIAILLFLYSWHLKQRFLVGHLAIAVMGAALLPFGALAIKQPLPVLYSAFIVFPAFIAREILKTVPDYAGDKAHNVDNLATRYGPRIAFRAAQGILLIPVLALPLMLRLWPLNALYMVVVALVIWPVVLYAFYKTTPERASTLIMVSKMLFLLTGVALLLGSLPVVS